MLPALDIIKVEADPVLRTDLLGTLGRIIILDKVAFFLRVDFHLPECNQNVWFLVQAGVENILVLVVLRGGCSTHTVKVKTIPVLDVETEGILRSVFEL